MSDPSDNYWRRGDPPEKMMASLGDALDRMPEDPLHYDQSGLAEPPWKAFPDYKRYSLGWRMGGGEDYWVAFCNWYESITVEQQAEFQSIYPTPEGWDDFYEVIAQ